jgi:3-oxoacyl-[acyl-carrier protein] reductase
LTELAGRRALVTGAGQGVGRGIALALAAAGAEVVVNDLAVERAESVVAEVKAAGGTAVAATFDVTDFAAVTEAIEALGPVDILDNNAGNAGAAGMASLAPFATSEPADWERYLQVNLYGVLHCCRAVLPVMIERSWGRIITIVSDAARIGEKNLAVYGAAKAGAAGLTRALALEGGKHGITANNISLGTMRTPVTEAFWSDPDNPRAQALMQSYAVRRPGSAGDVSPLVVLLASEQGSWITGQTYPVNGGYSFAL